MHVGGAKPQRLRLVGLCEYGSTSVVELSNSLPVGAYMGLARSTAYFANSNCTCEVLIGGAHANHHVLSKVIVDYDFQRPQCWTDYRGFMILLVHRVLRTVLQTLVNYLFERPRDPRAVSRETFAKFRRQLSSSLS